MLKQTIESLKKSAECSEIVGKPIVNGDGTIVLPVSKISVGFVAGGADYEDTKNVKSPTGVSGGGVSVTPVGFLVCGAQKKFVRVDGEENKWLELIKSVANGVVVTHEHSDHIAGLCKLSPYTKVYAHPLTAMAMCQKYDIKNVVSNDDYESGFKIGDISVEPFRIPHDAAYPLAYTFDCQGARCSVATDIGVPTRGVVKNVKDSEVVLLESNHDLEMLKNGKYPPVLKARIMSNQGHLSNDAAARIASILCDDSRIKQLVLGHISENNNTEQKAYDAVENALKAKDSDIELYVAHQSRRSEVFEIL